MISSARTPALFIGHGSPMNTLESNGFTSAWAGFARDIPRPRAVLVVSAHWFMGATAVTAMSRPRTIHDFYGFPEALRKFQYPALGLPDLAGEIVEVVKPTWVGRDEDQWGLDHGAWSVLAHLYPEADIPIVQLSINALKPMEYHLELGRRLAVLRDRGVLILASGNVVHNLALADWKRPDAAFDWARRFDDAVEQQVVEAPADVLRMIHHPDHHRAVPTPEHFLPLLYFVAQATEAEPVNTLVRGFAMGSLSMTCYGVGCPSERPLQPLGAATIPADTPPDESNT